MDPQISPNALLLLRGCDSQYGSAAKTIVDVRHVLKQMAFYATSTSNILKLPEHPSKLMYRH